MELRILRNFIAVVEEEGVSAAADALRISQPALSRQIKDLEDEVGATLFVRGNRSRSLELTEKGRLMYRRRRHRRRCTYRGGTKRSDAHRGTSHDTTAAQASASPRAAARRLWAEYH